MKGGTVFGPNLKIRYNKLEINATCNRRNWLDKNLYNTALILSPEKFIK